MLRRREAVPQQGWRSLAELSMSNVINPGPRLRELSFHRQRLVFFTSNFVKTDFKVQLCILRLFILLVACAGFSLLELHGCSN